MPNAHSLSSISGANNAIIIEGSAAGKICLSGPGAGKLPTASAVVGDVITLCQNKHLPLEQKSLKIKNKENKNKKSQCGFKNYLRLVLGASSKPGVLISALAAYKIIALQIEHDGLLTYTIVTDSQSDEQINKLTKALELHSIKVVSRLRILEDESFSLTA